MQAERIFVLPETIEGDIAFDVGRQAASFEAHVASLEKERACSTILGIFKRHPHLDALQFLVRDGTDDEVTSANGHSLRVLDVTPIFSEVTREEDRWDESCEISAELAITLTARNADFFEGLSLRRSQVLSADGACCFTNLRAMRTWIEIDLK